MKFTEGSFRDWGYEVAADDFGDQTLPESATWQGEKPNGRIVVNDRIADAMFQQVLLRPDEYEVIVTPNLNGDYLSDACAAQVGGLGMRRVPTSETRWPCSRRRTVPRRSTRARTK